MIEPTEPVRYVVRKLDSKQSQQLTKYTSFIGVLVAIWVLIWPSTLSILVAMLMLPVSLLCVYWFKGVLCLGEKISSKYFDLTFLFTMPAVMLFIRGLKNYNILCWDTFWMPFAVMAVITSTAAFLAIQRDKQNTTTRFIMVAFCCVYSAAAVIMVNGIADTSEPTIHQVQVVGKRFTTGKGASNYLKVSPWGPRSYENEVKVSQSAYDSYQPGSTAVVTVRDGRLGIPWYYISKKEN